MIKQSGPTADEFNTVKVTEQADQLGSDINDKFPHVTFVRAPIVSKIRSFNNEATPCIAFAYLSAYVGHHGYTHSIVDGIAEGLNRWWLLEKYQGYHCQGLTFKEIIERIPIHSSVIAVSAMFSGEWPVLRDLIGAIRVTFPTALIIAGGEHITALTEYSLRDCPQIDICVRGEGEHTLLEILETFRLQGDFSLINGVGFIDSDGRYVQTEGLPRIREIDTIPWPLWPEGYLEKFWQAGKSYGVQSDRDMPILGSRGCPYQCTFCSSPSMWTTRYVLRDVDDLIREIKSYITRYNITALQFYDLTAITKKRWTVEFCKKLLENDINLKWSLPSGTRSEALDKETLAYLKKTNCNYLVYAPESGSQNTLKVIKKRIKLDRLTESVIEAKRQGIVTRTNLIIGFPHESRRDTFETIRYGLYLAWLGADEVSINIFSPYPGTEIFDSLLEKNKVFLGDEYFLALTSLNSDYTSTNPLTCNDNIGPRELAFYRITFMLLNYIIGYIRFPRRIFRTIHNLFFLQSSADTVFEHRLRDLIRRRGG